MSDTVTFETRVTTARDMILFDAEIPNRKMLFVLHHGVLKVLVRRRIENGGSYFFHGASVTSEWERGSPLDRDRSHVKSFWDTLK